MEAVAQAYDIGLLMQGPALSCMNIRFPPFVSSGSNEAPGDTLFTGQAVRGPGRWDRRSWTSVQDGDWRESDPGSSRVRKQS